MSKQNAIQYRQKAPGQQDLDALAACFKKGQFSEAANLARRLTEKYPEHELGWSVLGAALRHLGKTGEAVAALKKAVAIAPNVAGLHLDLAMAMQESGFLSGAESSYLKALQIQPDFAPAHSNLGVIYMNLGQNARAEASYRRALSLKPDYIQAHYNLGIILAMQERFDEAVESYKTALQFQPDYAHAHLNLGNLYKEMERYAEAEACYREAIRVQPGYGEAHTNLGLVLHHQNKLEEALACYLNALELKQDFSLVYGNLANTMLALGRLEDAEACYRKALEIKPEYFRGHSNLLFSYSYMHGRPVADYLEEARRFSLKVDEKVWEPFSKWACEPQPKRLRIGLVSGDFNNHPVGFFLESLLAELDQSAIELIAYPTSRKADELTSRIKPHFTAWKPIWGMTDEVAARMIHSDGVHVLVDLAGHTADNRLPVFAWKPAPVQVSWLGYFASTGLQAMDYFISDPQLSPEADDSHFTEEIWRLPETRLCFSAPRVDLNVAPLPALTNGYITFGCFNVLPKLNDEVIALWTRVLDSIPDSRLLLKSRELQDPAVQNLVLERFATFGVAPDRLMLEGPSSRADYLAAYNRVDIALDPFPFTGCTTSVEGLWMGVPVLTLAGDRLVSRQGVSILENAGLSDWIANSPEDYVARAISHAGNLESLGRLRGKIREQISTSPLMDAARFARNFESALSGMWAQWKSQHADSQSAPIIQAVSDKVEIVSATRYSEKEFWEKSALGISLRRLGHDHRVVPRVSFENSRGLSEIFNERIVAADSPELLVFVHDDVWIDDCFIADRIREGLGTYDVIGVAGNRRRVPGQPGWGFLDSKFTPDGSGSLSGAVAHSPSAFGPVSFFGPAPADCELLDGVFLAARKSSLIKTGVQFDPVFDFHFYDLDFCRSARNSGLRLGTWPVALTHQSTGEYGSVGWKAKYELYLKKWEN